jgi:TolB-like protein
MTGDVDQEYFCDGVAEDIATQLSHSNGLFVVAGDACLGYKARPTDARQIGAELGVRYVLQGSVRREGPLVQIGAQLLDADIGKQVWTERFERAIVDLFEVQDEISDAVALAIQPEMSPAERQRISGKPIVSQRVV